MITIDKPFLAENLQMPNYTGPSIIPSIVSFYIKTINEAFTYHRNDFSNSTNYIQNRLAGSYSGYFEVIILNHNVTGNTYLFSMSESS